MQDKKSKAQPKAAAASEAKAGTQPEQKPREQPAPPKPGPKGKEPMGVELEAATHDDTSAFGAAALRQSLSFDPSALRTMSLFEPPPGQDSLLPYVFLITASLLVYSCILGMLWLVWALIQPYATGVAAALLLSVVLHHRLHVAVTRTTAVAHRARQLRDAGGQEPSLLRVLRTLWAVPLAANSFLDSSSVFNGFHKYPVVGHVPALRKALFLAVFLGFAWSMDSLVLAVEALLAPLAVSLLLVWVLPDVAFVRVVTWLYALCASLLIALLVSWGVVSEGLLVRHDVRGGVKALSGLGIEVPDSLIDQATEMVSSHLNPNVTQALMPLVRTLRGADNNLTAQAWDAVAKARAGRFSEINEDSGEAIELVRTLAVTAGQRLGGIGVALLNSVMSGFGVLLAVVNEVVFFGLALWFLISQDRSVVYQLVRKGASFVTPSPEAAEAVAEDTERQILGQLDGLLQCYWHVIVFNFVTSYALFFAFDVDYPFTASGFGIFFALVPLGIPVYSQAAAPALVCLARGDYPTAIGLAIAAVGLFVASNFVTLFATSTFRSPFLLSTSLVLGFISFGIRGVFAGPVILIVARVAWDMCGMPSTPTLPASPHTLPRRRKQKAADVDGGGVLASIVAAMPEAAHSTIELDLVGLTAPDRWPSRAIPGAFDALGAATHARLAEAIERRHTEAAAAYDEATAAAASTSSDLALLQAALAQELALNARLRRSGRTPSAVDTRPVAAAVFGHPPPEAPAEAPPRRMEQRTVATQTPHSALSEAADAAASAGLPLPPPPQALYPEPCAAPVDPLTASDFVCPVLVCRDPAQRPPVFAQGELTVGRAGVAVRSLDDAVGAAVPPSGKLRCRCGPTAPVFAACAARPVAPTGIPAPAGASSAQWQCDGGRPPLVVAADDGASFGFATSADVYRHSEGLLCLQRDTAVIFPRLWHRGRALTHMVAAFPAAAVTYGPPMDLGPAAAPRLRELLALLGDDEVRFVEAAHVPPAAYLTLKKAALSRLLPRPAPVALLAAMVPALDGPRFDATLRFMQRHGWFTLAVLHRAVKHGE